jgi:hypothetical protein
MRNPFATAYKPLPYYSSSIENILPTGQFWFLVLISRRRKEIKKEKGKERDKRALTKVYRMDTPNETLLYNK